MLAWVEKTGRGVRRFLRANSGAIAPMYALMVVPMTLSVGVAVDIGRSITARNNLQDALDATGLAISHMGYNSSTSVQTVTDSANAWIIANIHDKSICGSIVQSNPKDAQSNKCSNITLSVTPSLQSVKLVANATVPTMFGALAGISQVPIGSTTVVQWGMNHIELAMVLDNTGSMADDKKLTSLISAAKSLVTTLLASNTSNDPNAVKISIVPFSNTVNVGTTYGPSAVGGGQANAATWLDPTAAAYAGTGSDIFKVNPYNGAPVNRFTLYGNLGVSWGGCVETRPEFVNGVEKDYDINDTAPSSSYPGTQFVPYFAPDEPDSGGYYYNNYLADGSPSTGSQWSDKQGNTAKYFPTTQNVQVAAGYYTQQCTGSGRHQSCPQVWVPPVYQQQTVNPTLTHSGLTSEGTGYPYGPNFGCGVAPMLRLTNSSGDLTTEIGKMVATGDTNVPMGLFWGWMALSPNAPFSDGVAYGTPNVTKIVIILTDGANHSSTGINGSDNSFYSGVGYQWQALIKTNTGSYSDPGSSMNDREAKICANMKAKGIVIYSVPVEVTDATAQSLLQGCASSASNYINVTSSSQLQAAFTNIAGSIGHLRISQ